MPGLVAAWLRLAAVRIAAQRVHLSDLDAAIGDGDHGYNLARGFDVILADLEAGRYDALTEGAALEVAGRTITGTVGGASGALYGRALGRAGARLDGPGAIGREDAPVARAAAAFEAAAAAIAALGRSAVGQKTMLDALVPAAHAIAGAAGRREPVADAFATAALAAEAGAIASVPLLAIRGRASYLGERSRGHMDPGAASTALLLRALADAAATLDAGTAERPAPATST